MLTLACVLLHTSILLHGVWQVESNQSTTRKLLGTNSMYIDDGGDNIDEHETILGANVYADISGHRTFQEEMQQDQETRIIGGQGAWAHSWPWQVSLTFATMPACGGAVISPEYVITAAHCFKRYNKASFWAVLAGTHDLDNPHETSKQMVKVAKIISHQGYNKRSKENDLAILKLKEKLTFNQYVRPIDIWMKPLKPPLVCTITGWGANRENGPRVHILQEVNVTCMSHRTCNRYYRGRIKPTMVCAGDAKGGVDACQGDSGGPMSCFTGTRWELGGVVSWGVGCGRARRPGVYTQLQDHVDWINAQLKAGRKADTGLVPAISQKCGMVQRSVCQVQPTLARLSVSLEGQVLLGGVTAACRNSWPWQVSLQTADGYHYCSGTLIHRQWVLVPRHCHSSPKDDLVVLGVGDLNYMAAQSVVVEQVFSPPGEASDLSLIHLSVPARIGTAIFPVCIPDGVVLDDSWSCVTTGWGKSTAAVDVNPDTLHQARLSLVEQTACRNSWGGDRIKKTHLCMHSAGSASCMGDSGAPLFCQKHGVYYLFGLVTWGNRRCKTDKPAVFTSIAAHRKWIQKITSVNI